MNQTLQGQPLTIFGDGEQTRAFSYIDDVAPIIARSIANPKAYGEVFNVGGDRSYTVNELARVVSQALGSQANILYLASRNEVKHAYASHDKMRQFFDVPVPVTLDEGVGRMAAWVKQVGSRQTRDFAAIEIPRGLPQGWGGAPGAR
jgi:UDP-glucose 4-epimerase